jgi:hypothetical protein
MNPAEEKLNTELQRLKISLIKKDSKWLIPQGDKSISKVLIAAILFAMHEHNGLICAAMASPQRDLHNFSPLILALDPILGTLSIPSLKMSPDPDFFMMALNAIVADSLRLILDEIGDVMADKKLEGEAYFKAALPVLYKHAIHQPQILFKGDSFSAFAHILDPKTIRVFEGIMTPEELKDHYDQAVQKYVRTIEREMKQLRWNEEMQKLQTQMVGLGWEAKGKICAELVIPRLFKK